MTDLTKVELTQKTFDGLHVDERVLTTASRTIAIKNISSILVNTVTEPKSVFILLFGLALLAFSFFAFAASADPYGPNNQASVLAGFLGLFAGIGLIAYFLRGPSVDNYLIISSNDGVRTFFTGPRDYLEKVRELLTEKINNNDEAAVYNFDFRNQKIDNLTLNTITQGDNASAVIGDNAAVQHNVASGEGARAGTADHAYTVENSPGANVGAGQVNTGTTASGNTVTQTRIAFGRLVDDAAQWRVYLAQQRPDAETDRRLAQLEELMKRGAPNEADKTSVLEIVRDLGAVAQAIPAFEPFLRYVWGSVTGQGV